MQTVAQIITSCEWDTARLLIFSGNVFGSLIYYSHLMPLVLSLAIGLFALVKNPKLLASRILFAITMFLSIWLFSDLVLWATEKPSYTIFFWSLTVLTEPIIYALSLYFVQVLITKKDTGLVSKLLIALPLIPTTLLAFTRYSIVGFDLSSCDREAIQGSLVNYGLIIEVLYTLVIILFSAFHYYKIKEKIRRSEIAFVVSGIILMLVAFSWGNIVGTFTDDWQLGQYGLFGIPVFIGFLVYSIVKFKTLNIKLLGSFALVFSLAAFNFSMIFIRYVETMRVLTIITFVLTLVFGIALIKSILKEIRQKEHIEQLVKARSEFLYVASHQLRTPVSLITGTLSLLKEGSLDKLPPEKKAQFIDGLFHKSQKLTNIVNDILQASEMDIVDFKLLPNMIKPVNLRPIIKEVCNTLKQKADEKKLPLVCSGAEGDTPLMVSGNADYIEQIVSNLVDNAIKYTTAGQVKVGLREAGNKAIIEVSDTGIGIPLDEQTQMFGKFKRARNAFSSYTDGSGLGLFIVKKIVESHPGGQISFQSAGENQGTTFTVELTKVK